MKPLGHISIAVLACALAMSVARAQSLPKKFNSSTGQFNGGDMLVQGYVPTPAEWNNSFAIKQDYLGPSPLVTLGAAASGVNSDIISLLGLLTPLSTSQGGTGATTPSGALFNLGVGTPVVYADVQTGVDWCGKVTAAVAGLPTTGGIVDARGLTGAQSCAGGLTVPTGVVIEYGATVLSVSAQMTFGQSTALECPSSGLGLGFTGASGGPAILKQANGANLPVMVAFTGGKSAITGGCVLDGNKANNTSGAAVLQISSSMANLDGLTVQNGPGDNIQFISTGTNNSTSQGNIRHIMSINAAKRGLYCFGGADTMLTASEFENNGAAGLELDNCPTWRETNNDYGGNGAHGYNGRQGLDTTGGTGTSPSVYVHGQSYVLGLYLGAVGQRIVEGAWGNNYGQDLLVDGSSPTNVGTLGGTITAGDVVTLTFAGTYLNGGTSVPVAYIVQGGDTLTSIAAALASAINANTTLTGYEIGATAAGGVLTVYFPAMLQTVASAGVAPTATNVTVTSGVSGASTETISWGGVSLNGGGTASWYNEIVGGYFIAGPNRTANLYYPAEIFDSPAGVNNVGPAVAVSNATNPYAGIALAHGNSGYDLIDSLTAAGTFGGTPTWASLLAVATNTSVKNVCSSQMTGCFNNSATFTSSAASTFANQVTTLGGSASDQQTVKESNPSGDAYAAMEHDFCTGGVCSQIYALRQNGGTQALWGVRSPNLSSTQTLLMGVEAKSAALAGCSFGTPSQSQPHGTAALSATCTTQDITVTFNITALNGWVCGPMVDRNTGIAYNQKADSTTTAVFKAVSGSSADVMQWGPCNPY